MGPGVGIREGDKDGKGVGAPNVYVGKRVGEGDGRTLEGLGVGESVEELHAPELVITALVVVYPCSKLLAFDVATKDVRNTPSLESCLTTN